MRIVIDTNVAVSGLLWGGAPLQVLAAAREGAVTLIVSDALLEELEDVLSRPKFASRFSAVNRTIEDIIANYRALVELIEPAEIAPVIVDDPDDDAVLACALGGRANYIVSGDKHLLDLGSYAGIAIWNVNRFLDEALI